MLEGQLSSQRTLPQHGIQLPNTDSFVKRTSGHYNPGEEEKKLTEVSQLITSCVQRDERLPDLYELLSRNSSHLHGGAKVSGDYLYDGDQGPLLRLNRVSLIPEALLNIIEEVKPNEQPTQPLGDGSIMMGLLAPISRAWLSIGSKLYLWSFDAIGGSDLTYFEKESDTIIDVTVVRPRSGVFIESISWLLVVTTVNEVTLLGVELVDNTLTLHKTGLFFSSDAAPILCIADYEGRIFAGSQDGIIYELEYFSDPKWFGRRCQKRAKTGTSLTYILPTFLNPLTAPIVSMAVNVVRGLMFALSEDSSVSCYSIKNGSFSLVGTISLQIEEHKSISNFLSIEAVDESPYVSAVAFSQCGARVYLSCLSQRQFSPPFDRMQASSSPPSNLTIALVRLAPEDPGMRDLKILVHKTGPKMLTAFGRNGLYVSTWTKSLLEDAISVIRINYPSIFAPPPMHGTFSENVPCEVSSYDRLREIEGRIWAVQELTLTSTYLDDIASFPVDKRQIVILSNAGAYVFDVLCPKETFESLLACSSSSIQSNEVKRFFDVYTPVQGAAIALGLAIELDKLSKTGLPNNLILQCKSALQMYCRTVKDQTHSIPSMTGGMGRILVKSEEIRTPLFEGLFLLVGRILKAFWKSNFNPRIAITSSEASFHLAYVQSFITNNLHLWANVKQELTSVNYLRKLIERCIELAAFLSICFDYCVLPHQQPNDMTPSISNIDFEGILTNPIAGQAFISELMDRLMNRQLKMQTSVDSLCALLMQRCSFLFKSSRLTLYEGVESLERAKRCKTIGGDERKEYLKTALDHFVKSADSLSAKGFDSYIREFMELGAFVEIVLLGVAFAKSIDPADEALTSYHMITPAASDYGVGSSEIVSERLNIYEQIIQNSLQQVLLNPSGRIPSKEADSQLQQVLNAIASSRDELFQVRVFDWIFETCPDRKEQLILSGMSGSKYLENYLVQRFNQEQTGADLNVFGVLLWKHYGKQERFLEAAQVLTIIATKPVNMSLKLRIEALSRAVTFARTSKVDIPKNDGKVMKEELEDRLEVALIQLEIYEILRKDELNTLLFSLSDLYNKYAKPNRLFEVCLRIIQTAGHYDGVEIGDIWRLAFVHGNVDRTGQNISILLKRFAGDDNLTPLNVLVDLMLKFAKENQQPPGWVSSLFEPRIFPKLLTHLLHYINNHTSFTHYLLEEITCMVRLAPGAFKDNSELKEVLTLSNTKFPADWKTKIKALLIPQHS